MRGRDVGQSPEFTGAAVGRVHEGALLDEIDAVLRRSGIARGATSSSLARLQLCDKDIWVHGQRVGSDEAALTWPLIVHRFEWGYVKKSAPQMRK
jgi:hypothetical protein